MSHAVHRHFPLIDVTYVLLAKLVRSRSRWLDIGRAPFCALIEKQKQKKGTRPLFRHFDRTSLVKLISCIAHRLCFSKNQE